VIRLPRRDELARYLKSKGIETVIHYPIPLHLQPAYKRLGYKPGDFPVTEKLVNEIISLPIYPELSEEQIAEVVAGITEFLA
jgi:dTDP-4-amino-4,6-dideoxygalactose transaminase